MQMVHMPDKSLRTFRIAVEIGQYHFITWDGWKEEWITKTPREWWKKQQWLRDGGYTQDESQNYH